MSITRCLTAKPASSFLMRSSSLSGSRPSISHCPCGFGARFLRSGSRCGSRTLGGFRRRAHGESTESLSFLFSLTESELFGSALNELVANFYRPDGLCSIAGNIRPTSLASASRGMLGYLANPRFAHVDTVFCAHFDASRSIPSPDINRSR